jgi:hypothetical protein
MLAGLAAMNLVNTTKLQAAMTTATDKHARESVVVVVKGTFAFPERSDGEPALAKEQMPLVMTDHFTGEPGFSSTKYEIDFAPFKPRCDVLVNGSAYAPAGRPIDRCTVGVSVGKLSKSFDVVGKRVWQAGMLGYDACRIEPFTQMPISYDVAFGGVDRSQKDVAKHRYYSANYAGVGYHHYTDAASMNGKPLPNTEETGRVVTNPKGDYRPMALGPVGRSWRDRIKWAGTYDQKWLDKKFPHLPDDFDDRYFQAAPEDQQTDYLKGGEEVSLANLTSQGRTSFRLPRNLAMPVLFFDRMGKLTQAAAVADTLIIEPDRRQFAIVWRTSRQVQRSIREVQQVVVNCAVEAWQKLPPHERRRHGKHDYSPLGELAPSTQAVAST